MTWGFLPNDYQPPVKWGYFKPNSKPSQVRILSSALIGYVDWDKSWLTPKPIRTEKEMPPKNPGDRNNQPKEFWLLKIWNHETKKVEVWEITQNTVKEAIRKLYQDTARWSPYDYDIRVSKSGTTKEDTKYSVLPLPKNTLSDETRDIINKTHCNLEALLVGEDPFTYISDERY